MMDPEERALLDDATRAALRAVDTDADAALLALGWPEMLAAEPRDAIAIVFDALGGTNSAASALDDVVADALGAATGLECAVLLPRFATWDAPATIADGCVSARGLASARVTAAATLLVVVRADDGLALARVPREHGTTSPLHGIDPAAGMHTVVIDAVRPSSVEPLPEQHWDDAVALAQRALAHQIAGACRTMLDLARSHALERVQFDRPVASFQAVRHRLAETLVAIAALDATLVAAADEPGALTAALAKATAGRTAAIVATHCQQVLAGVGFTTDHAFHRSLKRTMLLDGLFGTADELVVAIGRRLLAERRVPTLVEL